MSYPHHGALGLFVVSLLLTMFTVSVYVRGWLDLRATCLKPIEAWRAASFLLGLFLIWVVLASPLADLDHAFLTVHMIQHLLLMTFAAPLILLGEPMMLLWSGLRSRPKGNPRTQKTHLTGADVLARLRLGQPEGLQGYKPRAERFVRHPGLEFTRENARQGSARIIFCWLAATTALAVWHIPAAFALGMRSHAWHLFELASFFTTGLLFWWPVVQPWPSVGKLNWSIILYLFLATLPCDVLSGFLVFSERVAYPVYLSTSGESSLTVLADQQCAGALMWTCVTIVYLVVAAILSIRLLSPQNSTATEIDPQCVAVL